MRTGSYYLRYYPKPDGRRTIHLFEVYEVAEAAYQLVRPKSFAAGLYEVTGGRAVTLLEDDGMRRVRRDQEDLLRRTEAAWEEMIKQTFDTSEDGR